MECREDYVGLWSVMRRIKESDLPDGANVMEETLSLIAPLISGGSVVVGQFEDGKFREWLMMPEEILGRIRRDWLALGRDPDIGDIVWLVAGTRPS